jgi:hypothetical protein
MPPPEQFFDGPFWRGPFASSLSRHRYFNVYFHIVKPALVRVDLMFRSVHSARVTYFEALKTGVPRLAFEKVVRIDDSEWLAQASSTHQHLMIYFDEGPLFEFLCLGGHPKCTTCGRLKVYQGSVAT